MKKNERTQALTILIKVLQNRTPLSHALHSTKDVTPFCKELCFGICRHYIRLQMLANCLMTKPLKTKDIDVSLCILMGLYQLHYLHLPDYAVVQESVALLDVLKKSWAKGLVNAVLRNYCREKASLISKLENDVAFTLGHPKWLIEKVKQDWPNDWTNMLHANDEHPPMSLRVNISNTTRFAYLEQLAKLNISAIAHAHATSGIVLNTATHVEQLPGFNNGDVSVQDTAAQLAATLLDLKPGLRLLDACCAPGGKTCHILEVEQHLSEVVALDIDERRLVRVKENLDRIKRHATLITGDGASPNTWWDGKPFDRILLDAPCSATGVIRRHPDIKLLRTLDDILQITQIQRSLLHALWPLLATGGQLVYATCSIMPEENEQQIARFVKDEPTAHAIPIKQDFGRPTQHGRQILPGEDNMDGFFYSVLRKY